MKKLFAQLKKRPYIWFLLPGLILYTVFVIYPIFSAAQISMYRWNGIGEKVFVGFGNYKELFTTPDLMDQMINALKHCLMIFALTIIVIMPTQIVMSYTIYTKAKGKNFFQAAIFSPQFISTPVIVFVFTLLFDGNIGIVNQLLKGVGLGELARPWMGIPELGIFIVWIMISWAGMGVGMTYFLGAMNMLPTDCLEGAYLDGAGYWRRLFSMILPQIKMTVLNLFLVSYIVSMTIFDYSYILGGTAGGINRNMDVMSLFFYRMAFGDTNPLGGNISENSMGMGTTIAVVLFFMIFIVALFQMILMIRKEKDTDAK